MKNCFFCHEPAGSDGYGETVHMINIGTDPAKPLWISGSYFCVPKNWVKSLMAKI